MVDSGERAAVARARGIDGPAGRLGRVLCATCTEYMTLTCQNRRSGHGRAEIYAHRLLLPRHPPYSVGHI